MRAWRAERFGTPADVLRLSDIESPLPPAGFVSLRVHAAGVALPDLLMLEGTYPLVSRPPVSPGMEAMGTIERVGENVAFRVGERVMGTTAAVQGWGSLAEVCLADASKLLRVPAGMSDIEAAGFSLPFKTAHMALVHRASLRADETLVVLGGAGSSGAAAIQLGKALGAKVIAVAGGASKTEFCLRWGADAVIDYKAGNITQQLLDLNDGDGVDVVFDAVGGDVAAQAIQAIARLGRVVLVGFASGQWVALDAQDMVRRNYSAVGIFAGDMKPTEFAQTFDDLTTLVGTGAIRTPVGQIFSFDEVPTAINAIRTAMPGKIIVEI